MDENIVYADLQRLKFSTCCSEVIIQLGCVLDTVT